jgi:hypothetical protein
MGGLSTFCVGVARGNAGQQAPVGAAFSKFGGRCGAVGVLLCFRPSSPLSRLLSEWLERSRVRTRRILYRWTCWVDPAQSNGLLDAGSTEPVTALT